MKDESAYLKGDLDTTGIFTYLKPSVESSLFRNGKVLTRRDKDGSDSGWLGVDREQHEVPVYNARRLEGGTTLITSTHGGRVFEIDLRGRIVWELVPPGHLGRQFVLAAHRDAVRS